MRITRLLAGLVAIALLGFLPVAVSGSAEAKAVYRPVTIKGVERPKGSQRFYLKGYVGLDLAKKKIIVQRKATPTAKWRLLRKVRTTKAGKYKTRIARVSSSKKTCFRIKVKAANGYETTISKGLCIVRVRV